VAVPTGECTSETDRALLEDVRAIFERSGGTYGSPPIERALEARGHRVSGRRVARLMRHDGLRARVARVYRGKAGVHRWLVASRITCVEDKLQNRIRSGSAT
jgi:transposase InsO family protein